MRYTAVWGTIGVTELLAHFLSLGWAVMFLLAAFAWTAMRGMAVADKARGTESRLNNLIPVIGDAHSLASNALPKAGGTVTGSLAVNGSHTVGGQTNTGTLFVSGGATTTGNHTVHGSLLSDNNVSAGGQVSGGSGNFGPVSSTGAYSGVSIHVSSGAQADGTITGGGDINANGTVRGNGFHASSSIQSDGGITAGGDINSGGTVRGALHASSALIDTMNDVASPAATVAGCKQAIDGMLNRM